MSSSQVSSGNSCAQPWRSLTMNQVAKSSFKALVWSGATLLPMAFLHIVLSAALVSGNTSWLFSSTLIPWSAYSASIGIAAVVGALWSLVKKEQIKQKAVHLPPSDSVELSQRWIPLLEIGLDAFIGLGALIFLFDIPVLISLSALLIALLSFFTVYCLHQMLRACAN